MESVPRPPQSSSSGESPSASGSSTRCSGKPWLEHDWLRSTLTDLCSFDRESATEGERQAAVWLVERLAEAGAGARIEDETASGTYWWPLGIGVAAGALAGVASLRARSTAARLAAGAVAAAAAAGIASDYPPGPRLIRKALPARETSNVIAEIGPADAKRTVVVVAHHDTAHAGLLFHPEIPRRASERFPNLWSRADTSPPMMFPVLGGPVAVALGSLLDSRSLTALGTALSAGAIPVFADIARRPAVAGANDNGTAVVLLIALARALADQPTESVRVMLVSTGSEESFSEGMKAFAARHFPELPTESTFFISVDTVGSPHLNLLEGEGFLRMYEYPKDAIAMAAETADELGIWLYPNLRLRNGTDGLEPLAAGYPALSMCSVTDYKAPSNYHWETDTPDRVTYETLVDAIRLTEGVVRRLDRSWI